MNKLNRKVVCKDGFSVSIQAHKRAYCTPRENNAQSYSSVELGYPSRPDSLIQEYADDPSNPTQTVYGYIDVNTVYLLLTKHQGVVSGDVPKGIPHFSGSYG